MVDQWGDDCTSYEEYPPYCFGGLFDTETFKAEEACCVCGGGEKIVAMSAGSEMNTMIYIVLTVLVLVFILLITVAVYLRDIYQRLKPEPLTGLNVQNKTKMEES